MTEAADRDPSLEQQKQALESFLRGTKVGDPKFMAFWDHVDRIYADAGVDDAHSSGGEDISAVLRLEIVNGIIQERSSAIPGYYSASSELEELLSGLESLYPKGRVGSFVLPGRPSDEGHYFRNYLYILREQIVETGSFVSPTDSLVEPQPPSAQ